MLVQFSIQFKQNLSSPNPVEMHELKTLLNEMAPFTDSKMKLMSSNWICISIASNYLLFDIL